MTAVSIAFYMLLTVTSRTENQHFYVMRAAYLAMTGYLVGYLGQERLNQEARLRALESNVQRERIARSLHDGYAQALAGVNLRLESCQELFRRGQQADAMAELRELQAGVRREYDELRAYIRSLIEREITPAPAEHREATRFSVHADFGGSARFVEHVLHIMLEATRNVRRHARASSAAISARTVGGRRRARHRRRRRRLPRRDGAALVDRVSCQRIRRRSGAGKGRAAWRPSADPAAGGMK